MKKMPAHIRALLDEWDVLMEKHEKALLAKDYDAAHKYGRELYEFVERHGKTMNIPEEQMEEIRQSRAECEATWQESKIAEAGLKQTRLKREKATEKYHKALLEMPPEGKSRTSH